MLAGYGKRCQETGSVRRSPRVVNGKRGGEGSNGWGGTELVRSGDGRGGSEGVPLRHRPDTARREGGIAAPQLLVPEGK